MAYYYLYLCMKFSKYICQFSGASITKLTFVR